MFLNNYPYKGYNYAKIVVPLHPLFERIARQHYVKDNKIQIEMSRNLFEGLRRHVREMGERGVSNNETKTK